MTNFHVENDAGDAGCFTAVSSPTRNITTKTRAPYIMGFQEYCDAVSQMFSANVE